MKVLISGINGFVGSNLTDSLKNDYELYGLSNKRIEKDGVIFTYSWDDLDKLPAIDAIIHLAGKAHDTKNASAPEKYFEINVGLTKKIFSIFLKSNARKFIYLSSVKAVADKVKTGVLTEEEVPDPQTPYGKSKLEAENHISGYDCGAGKKVYILRPAMIHGPGNKGNLNLLYNLVSKGVPYPLGSFKNQRSFTSIENLSFIIDQLLKRDIKSGTFLVADDETLSTNEIVRLIAQSLERKPLIWNLPQNLVKKIAHISDLLRFPFNSEQLDKLTENYIVSNRKLKQALNIELPVSAQDGLIATISSLKNKQQK